MPAVHIDPLQCRTSPERDARRCAGPIDHQTSSLCCRVCLPRSRYDRSEAGSPSVHRVVQCTPGALRARERGHLLAWSGTTVFRHPRVSGFVALAGSMRDFDAIYQAIPDYQVLLDGTAV